MKFSNVYELANHFAAIRQEIPFPQKKDYQEKGERMTAIRGYNQACGRVDEDFKSALLKHLEVDDHEKSDKLFDMAWEHGHSAGYNEVASYAEEFAELLK